MAKYRPWCVQRGSTRKGISANEAARFSQILFRHLDWLVGVARWFDDGHVVRFREGFWGSNTLRKWSPTSDAYPFGVFKHVFDGSVDIFVDSRPTHALHISELRRGPPGIGWGGDATQGAEVLVNNLCIRISLLMGEPLEFAFAIRTLSPEETVRI